LVQLLGSDRQDELRDFVDDVDRVRAGESLNTVESPVPSISAVKPIEEIKKSTILDKSSPIKAPPASKNNTSSKANGMVGGKQQKSYASVVPKKSIAKGNVQQRKESQQARKLDRKESNQATKIMKEEQQQHREEVLPSQGTAKVVCGCFGTMHKALNNCLHCGRISCEREGYDYCPFCSYMVYENRSETMYQSTSSATTTINKEAWEQKERLLQYDREFAQRTIILDDQADYYNRATSSWLSEQERQEAEKHEQERANAIQKRPAPKMSLDI
jgi:activating signal cointegrator 1